MMNIIVDKSTHNTEPLTCQIYSGNLAPSIGNSVLMSLLTFNVVSLFIDLST